MVRVQGWTWGIDIVRGDIASNEELSATKLTNKQQIILGSILPQIRIGAFNPIGQPLGRVRSIFASDNLMSNGIRLRIIWLQGLVMSLQVPNV